MDQDYDEVSESDQFNDVNPETGDLQHFIETDLNFNNDLDDDDIDQQIDRRVSNIDEQKFQNELLFYVQGLGSVQNINDIDIYIKNDHCEESLKQLIRYCKRDDPDEPKALINLGRWNILETDLVPLLITQPQDKRLSFFIVVHMVQLTEFPTKTSVIKDEQIQILQNYKAVFNQSNVMKTLMVHLAECLSNTEAMNKIHEQMIELIVILVRNLLQIPDMTQNMTAFNEHKRNLQLNLLEICYKDSVFDALIFIAQNNNASYYKKVNLVFLEIFYHIFSSFSPQDIMQDQVSQSSLTQMMYEENRRKQRFKESISSRHSRFGAQFKVKRVIDGTFKVVSNPNKVKFTQVNELPGQMHKPQQRKAAQKHQVIGKKSILLDENINLNDQDQSFKIMIRTFSLDFLANAFNPLIESCYAEVYTDSDRITADDKVFYFVLMAFGFGICRYKYLYEKSEKSKNNQETVIDLDLSSVMNALQITQFELIYSKMLAQATQTKKTLFDPRIFHATTATFLELLYLSKEMSLSLSSQTRKNAQILMQNIFHHDNIRMLRSGFAFCLNGLLKDQLVKTLIEIQGIYFDLLEVYSRGKMLTIQTDKRIKGKKKKKKDQKKEELEELQKDKEFIEQDEDDLKKDGDFNPLNNEDEEGHQNDDENQNNDSFNSGMEDIEDEMQFKERKTTIVSEFAILAEYSVINKMIRLISKEQLLTNPKSLNESIFKYFKRIVDLLQADWLFYQMDYMIIFQELIQTKEIINKSEFKNYVDLIRKILRNFFAFFQKNPLIVCESMFRFSDKNHKDAILSNYENYQEEFPSQNNQVNIIENAQVHSKKKWTQNEDKIILDNWFKYKDTENWEEHLSLLLMNLILSDKDPYDVKKRVKFYKLHKESENALQIFKDTHLQSQISLELAVKIVTNEVNKFSVSYKQQDIQTFLDSLKIQFVEFKQNAENFYNVLDQNQVQQIDFAIVPQKSIEFDMVESQNIQTLFISIDIREPNNGECYWRIPGCFSIEQINQKFALINQYLVEYNNYNIEEYNQIQTSINQEHLDEQLPEIYFHQQEDQENQYQQNINNV